MVARRVNARMRLCDELHLSAEAFDYAARAVARAIVNDQYLNVGICLRQDAGDGAGDRILAIMNRKDHGDERVV
jgi:hypothetical protein